LKTLHYFNKNKLPYEEVNQTQPFPSFKCSLVSFVWIPWRQF